MKKSLISRRNFLKGSGAGFTLTLASPAIAQFYTSIYPQSYGLLPNGSDCSVGLSQMIDDAAASGRVIFMSEGQWTCLSPIVKPSVNGKVHIKGLGRDNTQLLFPNGGGLTINYTNLAEPPEIEQIAFITGTADGTSVGLAITTPPRVLPPTVSPTYGGPKLTDLLFAGTDITKGWYKSVVIQEAWFPRLIDAYIVGIAPATAAQQIFASTAGIVLYNTQAPVIVRPKIYWQGAGIWTQGSTWNEGITVNDGEMVAVGYGLADQSTFPRSGIEIGGVHINAYTCCIQSNIRGQMSVHDCLLFMHNCSTCSTFNHIWLSGAVGDNIHDNTMLCPGVTAPGACAVGIRLDNSPSTKIHDNQFGDWAAGGKGIWLTGNSVNCEIDLNSRSSTQVPPPIYWLDQSTTPNSNRIWGNAPDQGMP